MSKKSIVSVPCKGSNFLVIVSGVRVLTELTQSSQRSEVRQRAMYSVYCGSIGATASQ